MIELRLDGRRAFELDAECGLDFLQRVLHRSEALGDRWSFVSSSKTTRERDGRATFLPPASSTAWLSRAEHGSSVDSSQRHLFEEAPLPGLEEAVEGDQEARILANSRFARKGLSSL